MESLVPPSRAPSLWHNRDYLLLVGSQGLSSVGSFVSQLALPLLVLALTHSPGLTGLAGAMRGLPYLVLSLPAGAFVDRWDAKRLMVVCDVGRTLVMASIVLAHMLGGLSFVHILLAGLVEGTLYVFFNIAESTCLPSLVRPDQIPAAAAQGQVVESVSALMGPALGGALHGVHVVLPFVFDAVSYLVSVVSLLLIRARLRSDRPAARGPVAADVAEGLRWLWGAPVLRFLAFLTGGLNLFSFGFELIIIVIAREQQITSVELGLILAAGGAGSILGAMATPALVRRRSFGRVMIGATWMWVLSWPLYGLAPDPWTLAGANALCFFAVPIYVTTQYSYRLAIVPDALLGRVNSVFRLIALGTQPLGLGLTGALLQWLDPRTTVFICFAPLLVLGIAAHFHAGLRAAESPADAQPS